MIEDIPFDRRQRRLRRDRGAGRFDTADYLYRLAADELVDRLSAVKRQFRTALDLGCTGGFLAERLRPLGMDVISADAGFHFARGCNGVQCDEDRLPFGDHKFDLVMSVGVLDSVNDLPGSLALVRRVLSPDGLFLGAMAGAGSLPQLKNAMYAADAATGAAAARIHPQIDVRAAGDLLGRAGFVLPVADAQGVDVRFSDLAVLISDLRGMGATNVLLSRSKIAITRAGLEAAKAAFAERAAPDGKTSERFEIIYLAGWSPPPAT